MLIRQKQACRVKMSLEEWVEEGIRFFRTPNFEFYYGFIGKNILIGFFTLNREGQEVPENFNSEFMNLESGYDGKILNLSEYVFELNRSRTVREANLVMSDIYYAISETVNSLC